MKRAALIGLALVTATAAALPRMGTGDVSRTDAVRTDLAMSRVSLGASSSRAATFSRSSERSSSRSFSSRKGETGAFFARFFSAHSSSVGVEASSSGAVSSDATWSIFRAAMRRGGGGSGNGEPQAHHSGASSSLRSPILTLANITKTYGDAAFPLSPTSNGAGGFFYSIDDPDVATVAGDTVTITGVGSATITVTQASDGNFAAGSTTATLTVNGIPPTITFNDVTKFITDDDFTLSPTSDSPGAFTFESGDTDVASISGNTAVLGGIGGQGTATITAHQAASGNYAAGSASMTLTLYFTYCVTEPCMFDGECVPTVQGGIGDYNFVCECDGMYSGIYCEMYDSFCNEDHGSMQGCVNGGTCEPDASGGYCECPDACWIGNYCEQFNAVACA